MNLDLNLLPDTYSVSRARTPYPDLTEDSTLICWHRVLGRAKESGSRLGPSFGLMFSLESGSSRFELGSHIRLGSRLGMEAESLVGIKDQGQVQSGSCWVRGLESGLGLGLELVAGSCFVFQLSFGRVSRLGTRSGSVKSALGPSPKFGSGRIGIEVKGSIKDRGGVSLSRVGGRRQRR
ncbi:hypothetical protein HAX54_030092 [Datura stramonium]|uniref:Uncharacterized protein n=1 Tax=Datura stramonium TaxID=4076 RepID=A0ABS8V8D0_DATST|nr:hypothetical protein [Datura stramonium]